MEEINYDKGSIDQIRDFCLQNHLTISVAESVTGGHVQAALSAADNALQFYQGGVTVYNIGQKYKLLGVEPIHALACNCVSEQVARQMAIGCIQLFCSDIGLAITGYAAPVPEQGIDQPFAIISIAHKKTVLHTERIIPSPTDSEAIQVDYTNQLMHLFNQHKHQLL
jgi:nicotinamide-nucleotide amidase